MRVLVLIGDRPNPPVTATRVRNYFLWPALSRLGVDIQVLGTDLARGAAEPPQVPGVDAEFFPAARDPLAIQRAWRVLTRSYHQPALNPALVRRLDELLDSWRPDVVHAEELRMAGYLPGVRGRPSRARQSVTFHNVESDLYALIANPPVPFVRPLVRQAHLYTLRRYEVRVAARVDLRLTYSIRDRDRYRDLYPQFTWTASRNGADARGIAPTPQPNEPTLLFVGTWSYGPNRLGLSWFLEAIAPHLAPGVTLTAAGSAADEAVRRQMAAHGVRFVDTPIDLGPLYDEHALSVVPLLQGSGTRGKILESLAHERLVVSTTKGAEGLDFREDEGVLIADEPEAFARRINEALANPASRAEAARRGREAVLARYDWSVVAGELKAIFEQRPATALGSR
jgi:glycosyltransferase involved in cell wall biosynthesis